jgi:hypothetical protein
MFPVMAGHAPESGFTGRGRYGLVMGCDLHRRQRGPNRIPGVHPAYVPRLPRAYWR